MSIWPFNCIFYFYLCYKSVCLSINSDLCLIATLHFYQLYDGLGFILDGIVGIPMTCVCFALHDRISMTVDLKLHDFSARCEKMWRFCLKYHWLCSGRCTFETLFGRFACLVFCRLALLTMRPSLSKGSQIVLRLKQSHCLTFFSFYLFIYFFASVTMSFLVLMDGDNNTFATWIPPGRLAYLLLKIQNSLQWKSDSNDEKALEISTIRLLWLGWRIFDMCLPWG